MSTRYDEIQPPRRETEVQAARLTDQLDTLNTQLQKAARETREYQKRVQTAVLVPGSFMIPGSGGTWLIEFIFMMTTLSDISAGLGPEAYGAPSPEMTIWTEHSRTEIYALDGTTNLDALIATTGLSPAVQDTLHRYRGQRLAIITLQTQSHRDQGLRLSWASPLTGKDSATYAYPLGTGSAWSRPIEMTSVYVVSDPGVDFHVAYPRLGKNRSGYTHTQTSGWGYRKNHFAPTILQHTGSSGYAVEQTVEMPTPSAYSRTWRVTYTQSNADEDIVITRREVLRPGTRIRLLIRETAEQFSWVIGVLTAIIIWMNAWHFVMPGKLGLPYKWTQALLWGAIYCFVGPLSIILLLLVLSIPISLAARVIFMGMFVPFPETGSSIASALVGILFFTLPSGTINSFISSRVWKTPFKKTTLAYAELILTALVAYGLFALVYLALVGGL